MLFLDGVYETTPEDTRLRFQWAREPTLAQLTQLAHTIARRVGRLLEREGLLERDTEQLDLGDAVDEDDPMSDLAGIPSSTELPWARTGGARYSRCRLSRTVAGRRGRPRCPATWPAFRCTPASRSSPISARNSNGCVATSAVHRCRKSACSSPRAATSATR